MLPEGELRSRMRVLYNLKLYASKIVYLHGWGAVRVAHRPSQLYYTHAAFPLLLVHDSGGEMVEAEGGCHLVCYHPDLLTLPRRTPHSSRDTPTDYPTVRMGPHWVRNQASRILPNPEIIDS